jgi:hypothetical protein
MLLVDNRFYLGNVPGFLSLVKILNNDPEFRMAFDFGNDTLEIESMMMRGVIGLGLRLVKSVNGILVPSPTTRKDRVTLRIDSGAFQRTLMVLNSVPYAYMSLWIDQDDVSICVATYGSDQVQISSAVMSTLTLDDDDTAFMVTANAMGDSLCYAMVVSHPSAIWRRYAQASTVDTVLRYSVDQHRLTWETRHQQTTMSLYLAMDSVHGVVKNDIYVCLLPAVLNVLRSVLQATDKHVTTLSISDDLPVRLFTALDTVGSFVRVYAGTKDDE